jgi:hypothetical protein
MTVNQVSSCIPPSLILRLPSIHDIYLMSPAPQCVKQLMEVEEKRGEGRMIEGRRPFFFPFQIRALCF